MTIVRYLKTTAAAAVAAYTPPPTPTRLAEVSMLLYRNIEALAAKGDSSVTLTVGNVDAALRDLVKAELEGAGYTVTTVANTGEASASDFTISWA